MKKLFWIVTAVASGIYIFIPEFTDFIPIIGWLDEATALAVLHYSLKQLDINIFKYFSKDKEKSKQTIIIEKDK